MREYDVAIIGAGGAGMMCAMHAGARGRKVALLDHTTKVGRKILISGGGRCNFTNIHAGPDNFVSQNPHFCKSALARFTPQDFIDLVKNHRISFHEKKLGQLFCDGSAQNIVDMLVKECHQSSCDFILDCHIRNIEKTKHFMIDTSKGKIVATSLVIATGGLSIPKIGATGFGYDLAKNFGLRVIEPFPALVGFNWNRADLRRFGELSGLSIDSAAACDGPSFRENILFTHTGLSGPAILQASLYWQTGGKIRLDLLPELDVQQWLRNKKMIGSRVELKNLLAEILPKRFAEKVCEVYFPSRVINEIPDAVIEEIAVKLQSWLVSPGGTVGFAKAEVTRGGINTDELSSKSMEAKNVPGLYFIGEVVDVTGQLGGFNFQWAWASGYAAAQFV